MNPHTKPSDLSSSRPCEMVLAPEKDALQFAFTVRTASAEGPLSKVCESTVRKNDNISWNDGGGAHPLAGRRRGPRITNGRQ